MVRIIGYKEREKEDGESFFTLELQGGIELVQSKSTGNFYATAKKAVISSTFNEQTCKALIGTEISGSIVKKECEPYSYFSKETGEEITLEYRWAYLPENSSESESNFTENTYIKSFSQNGAMQNF